MDTAPVVNKAKEANQDQVLDTQITHHISLTLDTYSTYPHTYLAKWTHICRVPTRQAGQPGAIWLVPCFIDIKVVRSV